MKFLRIALAAVLLASPVFGQTTEKRPIRVDDIFNMREVGDPQRSPDGRWVAYTVTTATFTVAGFVSDCP